MSKSPLIALAVLALMLISASALLENQSLESQSSLPKDQFNGVIYRLGMDRIEVRQPVSSSSTNLTLSEKTDDLSFLDSEGKMTRINVTPEFWRGDYNYRISLSEDSPGHLVYTLRPRGQQFMVIPQSDGPLKIILPEGYTIGNRLLGIARPDPDEVLVGEMGTELIWNNASRGRIFEVTYYKNSAPMAMMRIFAIIGAAAVILFIEYYLSMRRLRSIREKDQIPLR